MPVKYRAWIPHHEEIYLEHLLGDGDPNSREQGLERLCKNCRAGRQLRRTGRFLTILVGLLHDEAASVRRWALNALALIGTKTQLAAVRDAVSANREDPDVFAAGVSALAAIVDPDEAKAFFAKNDMPLEGGILYAAAQQSDNFKDELRRVKVDIDYASASDLRLVGLLIGLGKAPENLFTLDYPNSEVIGALNTHDDRLVAQYSVWATYENPKLGLRDLRIPLKDIEVQRPNVRKYIYRLITAKSSDAKKYYDHLVQGSQDRQTEVREGLAAGIRDIQFDAMDELVLRWLEVEENDSVRQALLEHMAKNAEALPAYRLPVISHFQHAKPNSLLRARIEAASHRTPLYRDLKIISLEQEHESLFDDLEQTAEENGLKSRSPQSRNAARPPASPAEAARDARVLVVVALPKELAAVSAVFDEQPVQFGHHGDPNIYLLGSFSGGADGSGKRAVLVTSSGVGNQTSSAVATNALRTFPNVEHVLMVGIAGGCPSPDDPGEHVRLGDIVVSAKGVIGYDHVKATLEGQEIRGTIQLPSARLLAAHRALQAKVLLGSQPWLQFMQSVQRQVPGTFARPSPDKDILHEGELVLSHPEQTARISLDPMVHSSVIGAADVLQKDPAKRDMLRKRFAVRAIEMEASGLQTAAWAQEKDIFVIRGICDYCDAFKNDEWQNYAALVAAAYARALIEHMPAQWFPE